MSRPTFFRQLLPVLLGIVAACLLMIVLLAVLLRPDPKVLGLDLIRAFVQIGIVAVAGAILNVMLKDRESARASAAALEALEKELLERITRASTAVKRQRRLLRARALTAYYDGTSTAGIMVALAPYEEHMRLIGDVELDLDDLLIELKALPEQFPGQAVLTEHVGRMKEYARKLLRQYERLFPTLAGPRCELAQFADGEGNPPLTDFVGPKDGSRFKSEFDDSFREAVRILRQALATGIAL